MCVLSYSILKNIVFLYVIDSDTGAYALGKQMFATVFRFEELEEFYLQVRHKKRSTIIPQEQVDDTATKLKICHFIFGSSFFEMNGEYPVSLNSKETYDELRHKYPKLFNELYAGGIRGGASTSKKVFKRSFTFRKDKTPAPPKYYDENQYRICEIWVEGYPVKESVFSCLTKDRRTNDIKQYYVSKLYNLNKHIPSHAIGGCFIFAYDKRDDLIIRALAQEPAEEAFFFSTIEKLYTFKRQSMRSARTANEDPMCQLSKAEKLRLCNQILSGSEFENLVRFYPKPENVEDPCRKREVSFMESDVRAKTRGVIYEKWMIGCKSWLIETKSWKTFYVSRGCGDHRAFLYGRDEGQLCMFYYTDNISVWN